MEDYMQIEESRDGEVLIVEPKVVRLDAQQAIGFKESLLRLIEGGDRQLILDLNTVEFMDSSGLGAVVAVLKRLGFHGVLVICSAHVAVSELFRLTRMDKVIQLVGTRAEALTLAHAESVG
jgi:anti-sigma B factor antagonist